jgi:DNA-binding XRE family transcriptional regulator
MNQNNHLRSMRKTRGVTQMEVAVCAGVSQSVLVACERYAYVPTPEVQRRIAATLQCAVGELWPENGDAGRAAVQA